PGFVSWPIAGALQAGHGIEADVELIQIVAGGVLLQSREQLAAKACDAIDDVGQSGHADRERRRAMVAETWIGRGESARLQLTRLRGKVLHGEMSQPLEGHRRIAGAVHPAGARLHLEEVEADQLLERDVDLVDADAEHARDPARIRPEALEARQLQDREVMPLL